MTIGQKIKQIRTKKGISRYRLQKETGLNYVTLIDIEQDKSNPQVNTLNKIADCLGVSLGTLFRGVDKSV